VQKGGVVKIENEYLAGLYIELYASQLQQMLDALS
jgi:hypothetical protein